EEDRKVPLPPFASALKDSVGNRAIPALVTAIKGRRNVGVPTATLVRNLVAAVLPIIVFAAVMGGSYLAVTAPVVEEDYGLQQMGGGFNSSDDADSGGGLAE